MHSPRTDLDLKKKAKEKKKPTEVKKKKKKKEEVKIAALDTIEVVEVIEEKLVEPPKVEEVEAEVKTSSEKVSLNLFKKRDKKVLVETF